jgi:2-polyprenyl-3-methyl-5-hydroxy-6-metoxy-1,4-benzoquinol methylase
MSVLNRARFALQHPTTAAAYLLARDIDLVRVAECEELARRRRKATGVPSELDELVEYLDLPRSLVVRSVVCGRDLIAARWRRSNPQTPEEIGELHRHFWEYLYDLVHWNMTPKYQGLLALLHVERDGACLSFGGGIGTEALQLAAQGNEVWYCDVPDSPVWRFAQWRAERRGAPVHFVPEVPEVEMFDGIVAFDVLETLPAAEMERVVRRMATALKPGGRLYCNVTFAPSDAYPMRSGQQRLWDSLLAELPLARVDQHRLVKRRDGKATLADEAQRTVAEKLTSGGGGA